MRGRCARPAGGCGGRGFTFLEALLATAILAMVTATVAGALSAGRQQTSVAQDTQNASLLAHALMREITRLPFTDPAGYTTFGPDPGETTRNTFDNVDDYSGYSDGPGDIADLAGVAYPAAFQRYERSVTMTPVSATPAGWGVTVNGIQVTVTVSRDGKTLVTLSRYVVP